MQKFANIAILGRTFRARSILLHHRLKLVHNCLSVCTLTFRLKYISHRFRLKSKFDQGEFSRNESTINLLLSVILSKTEFIPRTC